MRSRYLVDGASVLAVALFLGWVLSLATTRVKNWFVMTDELYYERLAVSVAQTGSVLPRLHGELVSNVNQLYPMLISPLYGDGNVPASLAGAHRLNAFLITSAAIPVYLLARRIGLGRLLSIWVGALSVGVPWVALASFLLTEVVAYPAFCWALLALTHAVARKTWLTDLLALVVIGVAVLARTQFVVLLAVFVVAVVVEAMLDATPRGAPANLWRTRRPFVVVFGALLLVVLGAIAIGKGSQLLGSYSVTAEHVRLDFGLFQLAVEHVALLALGLAILPFIVGIAWLVDRVRPSTSERERSFAVVGCASLVLVTLQVASFNQRFGAGLVKDRYLFYVVPVVLLGLAAAVASRQWPRWWALVVPTGVAAIGFASAPLALYEKFNVDSPIAILNNELLDLATSTRWAHVLLVLAVLVALQALLLAKPLLPWRVAAVSVAVLATIVLPLETAYAFDRLFAVNGTNGLPITLDQGVVFSWVDRNVGPTGRVTVMKYPVGGPDWWAGQGYWWDVEFWNESAVDTMADMSLKGTKHWRESFDPDTGAALDAPETRFAFVYGADVRFRLAGKYFVYERFAYLSRHRATLASGLDHRWDLPGRLDAAPPPRDDHGLRGARPAARAAAVHHDHHGFARPDRGTARYDRIQPRPLARSDHAEHISRPAGAGLRSARWQGDSDRRDPFRVGRLPRSDEVGAHRPCRPSGRRAAPLDRTRRRARTHGSLPDVR